MWRTRLPLGLLVVVASCQPTGDGNETDPLGELPPISDFPRSGGGGTVSPATTVNVPQPAPVTGAGGTATADPRAPVVGGTGGAGAPSAMSPVAPASPTGGAGGGGTAGGMDGGAPMPSGDAGISPPTSMGGDAGAAPVPDAGDAGCPRLLAPDSGICASYGCRLSRDQLRASANTAGACTSPAAVAAACDGSASSAALRCTEASVFSTDLSAAASACVKREPQLSALAAPCLDCFVDEALCTLSRCFALCALASENDACRACRHKECGSAFGLCSGLPAP